MAEKSKACPKCSGIMFYRLGEYECNQCDHHEPAAPAKTEEKRGFRKEAWHQQQQPPSSSPPPGTMHTPGVAPPPPAGFQAYGQPEPSATRPVGGSLHLEKNIYFGIEAALYLLFIVVALGLGLASMGSLGDIAGVVALVIGAYSLAIFVRLAILWFVFYGTQIWFKWICGGCTLLGLIGTLFSLIGVMSGPAEFADELGPLPGEIGGFMWFLYFIQAAFQFWFVSIVWRDIQLQRQ